MQQAPKQAHAKTSANPTNAAVGGVALMVGGEPGEVGSVSYDTRKR